LNFSVLELNQTTFKIDTKTLERVEHWESMSITVLDLSECKDVKHIPPGIGKIKNLETFILPKDLSQMGDLIKGTQRERSELCFQN
jgi:hypothetical protein